MNNFSLSAFLILSSISFTTQAHTNTMSCGLDSRQKFLGALPDFSNDPRLLFGFRCDTYPKVSSFLGDWFPSTPQLSISQQQRHKIDTNDIIQDWSLSYGIKRIAEGQLAVYAGQNLSEFTLVTTREVPLINKTSGAIATLNNKQKVRLSNKKRFYGLGMQFSAIKGQPLTEVIFQRSVIQQPLQANVRGFPKHSLFESQAELSEIIMSNQSYNRGLNINWQVGMGLGEVQLQPKALTTSGSKFDSSQENIVTLATQIEIYYQFRFNRRWFSYIRSVSDIQYWYQIEPDNNYKIADYQLVDYQAEIGMGLRF